MAGDGQASTNATIVKHTAWQSAPSLRREGARRSAGATADALTLFEKFEGKLEKYGGNFQRAAVELAKDWRSDRRCAGWKR
jgi:ATP-dependent HslUV protease subunit HslV